MKYIFSVLLIISPFLLLLTRVSAQDKYQVYVINNSNFSVICEGMPEKGGGVFSKYTPVLKPHKEFLFGIEPNKSLLPKGVEGVIKFRLPDLKYTGYGAVYFNNPVVGKAEFKITNTEWPFTVKEIDAEKNIKVVHYTYNTSAIEIIVDTTNYGPANTSGIKVTGKNNPIANMDEPIPPVINFEWQVTQRSIKDEEDDDNDGKAYNMVTYYFMTDGSYTAIKPEDKSFSLMIYTPKGHTWIFDDKKKTITVMNMIKTVGEGGMMGKVIAEDINKGPLKKDKDDEQYTVIKTGKTKMILSYQADEYQMKPKVIATKNAEPAVSFWYAKVPFDPVKIYTMGAGRPADLSKIENNPKMKNNIFSIPVLNKNYLWMETESGGRKGQETIEIKKVNNTIYTSGYKVKVMNSLKDMLKGDDGN